jgi:PhzF family phenazine biosynthesis protein
MGVPLYQIDAFTDRAFRGNPAAVCFAPPSRGADWMQAVASEMNLSETAFLSERKDGHDLRWFTPTVEVDLCGHATLAAAHALWESGALRRETAARFHTRSGLLTVVWNSPWIEMEFPALPEETRICPGVAEALGVPVRYTGANRFDLLAEVESEEAVRSLAPDQTALRQLPFRGVIVTARSSSPAYDFVSRFFAPRSGIDEDPVTGSAHCCLGPYWGRRWGKAELVGYQASQRGGTVRVALRGDRVTLAGQAVTVSQGELLAE